MWLNSVATIECERFVLIRSWISGSFKMALTVGRRLGTTMRQSAMSFFSPWLKLDETGAYEPRTIFMDSAVRLGASKGGFRQAISYSMTPIDQTSVLNV